MRVAIIGAGVSGLCAAKELTNAGLSVTLFEKSRGVGGRLSTRYNGPFEYDHGAQYFTATQDRFRELLSEAKKDRAVDRWDGRALYLKKGLLTTDTGGERWVGAPRMNSFAKHLAKGLDIIKLHRVSSLNRDQNGLWTVGFEDSDGGAGQDRSGFDMVICTAPPEQAVKLLPENFKDRELLASAKMNACFALMVGLKSPIDLGWESLRVSDLPVAWLAINSAKPGRANNLGTLVVHAAPEWSNAHAKTNPEDVRAIMMEITAALTRLDLTQPEHISLHRWLYASVETSPEQPFLSDPHKNLFAIGDWCQGGRVEGAAMSGFAVADYILQKR
ncbi:NAD(P)/FAD-dependent oxidoreductase [Litorimonas haliclonae]|uniref:NAD(P)/FAD-dependent oxidoreductase n=1 Tax=Litorimonas haliclonae TaxID=2081977 RepID=UPI0039EFE05E